MKILDLFNEPVVHFSGTKMPYMIAEAGVNHEGSLELAKRLIDEAAEGGAHAIKFQTYKAETIASKNSPAYWDVSQEKTDSQYKLFKKYDRFWKDEFETLKVYCDQAHIEFMSTPFDTESASFLNDLMDVFKISSSDITNKPFIEYISDFGKPIILSTGASNLDEISRAINWINTKKQKYALLHCILNYPTKDENANLAMIQGLIKEFPNARIGYSDHTLPYDMKTLELATILGATILEKHFTLDKSLPGNDHYHSMDKSDLKRFFERFDILQKVLGGFDKSSLVTEEVARKHARRSLVASRFIKKGSKLSPDDLTWKRPAHGVSPSDIDQVIGKSVAQDIPMDAIIDWDMLK